MAVFETKFNRGDRFYKVEYGQITTGLITDTDIRNFNGGNDTKIHYDSSATSDEFGTRTTTEGGVEEELYITKQEAGEAWLLQQNLKVGVHTNV